jgi:Lysylphosphatidylglycerol synthase TM region
VLDRIGSLFEAARQALGLILDRAVSVNPSWLAAGVVVYEVAQVLRTRGWFNIVHAAYPHAVDLRWRDVAGAYMAGVGLNSVLPARSGDFLKLFMVHRRAPGARYPTLIATFVPETLFESVFGAALVIWALAYGFLPVPLAPTELPGLDVSFIMTHPVLSAAATPILAIGGVLLARWLRPHARGLAARLIQGFAILRSPHEFVFGVASWHRR